jgi:hypothetical protein
MNDATFAARHLVAEEARWRALQGAGPSEGSGADKTQRWRLRTVGATLVVCSLAVFTALW